MLSYLADIACIIAMATYYIILCHMYTFPYDNMPYGNYMTFKPGTYWPSAGAHMVS